MVVASGALVWGAACATPEDAGAVSTDPPPAPLPEQDAAAPDAEPAAPPCTDDCEYFVAACADDVLCPNGLLDGAQLVADAGQLDPRTALHLVRGRSASDVWALGSLGTIVHFDGTSWSPSLLPPTPESPLGRLPTVTALWLRSESEVALGGFDRVFARGLDAPGVDAGASSDGWSGKGALPIAAITGYQPREQWLKTGWAAPGSEWFWLATVRTFTGGTGMSGLARMRVTDALAFDGRSAKAHASSFSSLHGATANDLWAVGMNGAVMRITDADSASPTFKSYDSQTRNALYGVWAASESDAWAVGFAGTIRHFVGESEGWVPVDGVPEAAQLNAVWGTSSSDVWAVGNDAMVLHYDGTSWSRMKIGGLGARRPDLLSVWAAGPGQVWIGGAGVLLTVGGKS